MEIRLTDFRIEERGPDVRAVCTVSSPDLPETLWFDVPARNREALDVVEPNWAAVGLLYPAMALSRALVVEAPLSPRLLHGLRRDVQDLVAGYEPHLSRIVIRADDRGHPGGPPAAGVATGFSAGIDSFTTLILDTADDIPPACRITDLAVFNVGAFDRGPSAVPLFRMFTDRCDSFAGERGFGSYSVNSNLDDFFAGLPGNGLFQRTHTLRDAAAALLLQKAVGRYLYSSGLPYSEVVTGPSDAISHMDPILLPLLSTEQLSLLSGVPALSRVAKTAIVAEDPDARRMLDVCITGADKRMRLGKINCSNCWKCVRTLLTLEALDRLDVFGEVFDLAHYRSNRTALIHSLSQRSAQGDLAAKEALAFARARGLPLPGPFSEVGRRAARLRRGAMRRSLRLLGAKA